MFGGNILEKEFKTIEEQIEILKGRNLIIKSIKFEKILHKMGFPENYNDLLN